MITKLRLRNWKSHLDSSFVFTSGVNALVGIMGSGKSSVTDAISFCLFGNFPALQGRKVALDDLLMQQPQEKTTASLEMEFVNGGKTYAIKREITKGKGSTAELREDGVLKEVSSRGVTKEIERLLEMDYEIFSTAVYSEQNGIDYFLRIPAGRRREHIDRMLRLDTFETVRTEAVSLQNKIRHAAEEKRRIVADMEKERLEDKLVTLQQEIAGLQGRMADLQKEASLHQEERIGLEKQLALFDKKEMLLEETQRFMEGMKGALHEITLREGKNRKAVIGKDIGTLDIELKKIEEALLLKRKETDSLKERLHFAETKKHLALENIDEIEKMDHVCPLCESEISEQKKRTLVDERHTIAKELEEEAATLKHAVFEKEKEISSVEKLSEEKKIERERVSCAFAELRELEEKLTGIIASKKRYEEQIATLQQELAGIDSKTVRAALQETAARERGVTIELRELQKRVSDKMRHEEELGQRFSLLKNYREETLLSAKILLSLSDFEGVLRITQEELRREFLHTVNSLMERVWAELYPYDDFESVRLAVDEGDYMLQLKRKGWVDADSVSGGERSLASLTLRIAFSLAFLPNLRWLILDEPTHNLDAQAIESFSDALRERIPHFALQVFLITHDPLLTEGLEHVHVLERDKGTGRPTVVRAL